ncbi:MAG: polysaccharide biosynthesis protein, partial [Spirochaetia bacterium]|nr:polysaccharide biosynthesis protein [Spirochaetia bacterium]
MGKIFKFSNLTHRRYFILPLDIFLIFLSFILAHTLRFDSINPSSWQYPDTGSSLYFLLGFLILIKCSTFILMGLYRSIWIYASLHDLYLILKATVISSLVFITFMIFYNRLENISRSVLILDSILLFVFLSFRSFSWRIFRDILLPNLFKKGKRALIIGAGETANRLARELRSNPSAMDILPVGFL